jgi:hypothetical protein
MLNAVAEAQAESAKAELDTKQESRPTRRGFHWGCYVVGP